MIQSFKQKILYHPLFLVFISPLSFLLFGTIFSLKFTSFHFSYFILLYLFILTTQFIEAIFNNTIKTREPLTFMPLALLEVLTLLLLTYFTLQLNYLVGLLLLVYVFVIHLHYFPYDLTKTFYSYILNGLFKGGILTYIAFFIQTEFINKSLFYWSIPLMVLSTLCAYGKQELSLPNSSTHRKRKKFIFLILLCILYLSNLIPYFTLNFGSKFIWIQLLSVPIALRLVVLLNSSTEESASSIKVKAVNLFQLVYVLLASISILLQILFP